MHEDLLRAPNAEHHPDPEWRKGKDEGREEHAAPGALRQIWNVERSDVQIQQYAEKNCHHRTPWHVPCDHGDEVPQCRPSRRHLHVGKRPTEDADPVEHGSNPRDAEGDVEETNHECYKVDHTGAIESPLLITSQAHPHIAARIPE